MSTAELGYPVVRAPGVIAREGVPDLVVAAAPHVMGEAPGIVLDMTDVEFISSAGLGKLVEIGMELRDRGAVLALAGSAKHIDKLLRTVGFHRVMLISRSVDEAVAALKERTERAS